MAEQFETNFYGLVYYGSFDIYIDWTVFYYGTYERDELQLMADLLAPIENPTILDIGANVGHHSLFFSTIAARVHAFEPLDSVLAKAIEKINLNGVNNVVFHRIGLGENDETMPFFPPTTNNTGMGSFISTNRTVSPLMLSIRRGDRYLEESTIGKVDFIKMDIEGFETFALRGLVKTLSSSRPICFFEWSDDGGGIEREDASSLFPERYTLYRILPNSSFLKIFNHGSNSLELVTAETSSSNNMVAVPNEYFDLLQRKCPSSRAARRLGVDR